MKTIEEIARIAAIWWADKVTSPKFDNGDKSFVGFVTNTMAASLVQPVDQIQRDKFIEYLVNSIVTELSSTYPGPNMVLCVDYGPDRELLGAALYSGVPSLNFPIKTVMWISKNHVAVKYGYSAPVEILYANSVYYKKMLANTEESIIKYKKDDALSWIEDAKERGQEVEKLLAALDNDLIKYRTNLKDTLDLELIEDTFAKGGRSQAVTISFGKIYGASRQCGKVDFVLENLKALERDPNCPPERPMEEILHEAMCSDCGRITDEIVDGLCDGCSEVQNLLEHANEGGPKL